MESPGVGSVRQVSFPPEEGLALGHGAQAHEILGMYRLAVWHTVHIWVFRTAETILTCLGDFLRPDSDPVKAVGEPGAPEGGG